MFKSIGYKDKLFFTKHLSLMVASGIPLTDSLDTLSEQTKSRKLKKVIFAISRDVKNGIDLGKAIDKHKEHFGQLYISLIEVGEKSGTLEKSLEFLAKQMSKDYALRKKIQGALFYPGIVFSIAGVMGIFITFFILPKLVEFFKDFDVELPLTTRILIFIGDAVQNHGVIILGVLAAFVAIFALLFKLKSLKPTRDKLILALPLLGSFLALGQVTRFCRNLGTLLQSGVPIDEALVNTAESLSNSVFKNEVLRVAKSLEKGKGVADGFGSLRRSHFPPVAVKMMEVGEKTGKLDETLLYLADFFEEDIDNVSKNLSTVIEPILLIGIGLAVAFVALAIISPIYELTGTIRN